jgi:hypothetical protein
MPGPAAGPDPAVRKYRFQISIGYGPMPVASDRKPRFLHRRIDCGNFPAIRPEGWADTDLGWLAARMVRRWLEAEHGLAPDLRSTAADPPAS